MKKIEDIIVDIDKVKKFSEQMFAKEKWSVSQHIVAFESISKNYQGAMVTTKNNWLVSSMATTIQFVCDNAHESGTLLIAFNYLSGNPEAQKMLFHYLFGKGEEVEVNTARVLFTDNKLKTFIYEGIYAALMMGKSSGSVNVKQGNYGNKNWQYAFGAINIPWIKFGPKIELWIEDDYKWHPEEKRGDQCVHGAMAKAAAQGAVHFFYHGSKMTLTQAELYTYLNKALPWKYK